jgi:hypothetical protein
MMLKRVRGEGGRWKKGESGRGGGRKREKGRERERRREEEEVGDEEGKREGKWTRERDYRHSKCRGRRGKERVREGD